MFHVKHWGYNMYNDNTINGMCTCCGKCCSNFLPLTTQEIKYLKSYVKLNKIKPSYHLIDTYSTCPFLNNKNKCEIYEIRPAICRNFKCDYYKTKDFGNFKEDKYILTDLRKEIFYESNKKMG